MSSRLTVPEDAEKAWEGRKTQVDARAFLKSVPFFAETLSEAQLDALATAARIVEVDSGTPLIGEGDATDTMYVLVQGSASVKITKKGEDRFVATLPAVEIVGEMSLLTGAPRAATVTADKPVVALEIDRSALRALLLAEPALFDRFAAILEKRQTQLDKLYGSGLWSLYGPPRANLATIIRTYFAALPDSLTKVQKAWPRPIWSKWATESAHNSED